MDLLDIVIVVLLGFAVASGWRRGLTWVSLSLTGLIVGIVIGAAVAGTLAKHLGGHSATNEALIGTGVFLGIVAVIQGGGTALGYRARIVTMRTRLARFDSGAGAALAVLGALVGLYFIGYSFSDSPYSRLDTQIQGSAILRHLDDLFPRPPAFLTQLRQIIRDPAYGNPFGGLGGASSAPLPIPASADTPGIRTASGVVGKVISDGCGIEAGSAWPLGNDLFVTNAHVVAGGQRVSLQMPDHTGSFPATVVLFDPKVDVAVLLVPGTGATPLTLGDDPTRGVTGAVIGYPRGGPLAVVPAAVRGVETAQSDDIYGSPATPRSIEVLAATVIPGDSGGPLVDRDGKVIGLVFAASTTDDTEGYALTVSQIRGDLQAAAGHTDPVSTQDCTN